MGGGPRRAAADGPAAAEPAEAESRGFVSGDTPHSMLSSATSLCFLGTVNPGTRGLRQPSCGCSVHPGSKETA
eukprot:7184475-Pyramimonas_sp.AAC.1